MWIILKHRFYNYSIGNIFKINENIYFFQHIVRVMILWLFHLNISVTYGRLKIFICVKLWAKWIKELIMKRKLKTLCLRRRREKVTYESFNLLTSLSKIWICSLIKPRYATRSGKYERGTTTSPKLLSNYVEFMHTITSQKYLGHIWCKEIKSENGPGGHHARPRATLAWLAGGHHAMPRATLAWLMGGSHSFFHLILYLDNLKDNGNEIKTFNWCFSLNKK